MRGIQERLLQVQQVCIKGWSKGVYGVTAGEPGRSWDRRRQDREGPSRQLHPTTEAASSERTTGTEPPLLCVPQPPAGRSQGEVQFG